MPGRPHTNEYFSEAENDYFGLQKDGDPLEVCGCTTKLSEKIYSEELEKNKQERTNTVTDLKGRDAFNPSTQTQFEKDFKRNFTLFFPGKGSEMNIPIVKDGRTEFVTFKLRGSNGKLLWKIKSKKNGQDIWVKIPPGEERREYLIQIARYMANNAEKATQGKVDEYLRQKILGIGQGHFVAQRLQLRNFFFQHGTQKLYTHLESTYKAGMTQYPDGRIRFLMSEKFYILRDDDMNFYYRNDKGDIEKIAMEDLVAYKKALEEGIENGRKTATFIDSDKQPRMISTTPVMGYGTYIEYTPSKQNAGILEYQHDKYHTEIRVFDPKVNCINQDLRPNLRDFPLRRATKGDFEAYSSERQDSFGIKNGFWGRLFQRVTGFPRIPDFGKMNKVYKAALENSELVSNVPEAIFTPKAVNTIKQAKKNGYFIPDPLATLFEPPPQQQQPSIREVSRDGLGELVKLDRFKKMIEHVIKLSNERPAMRILENPKPFPKKMEKDQAKPIKIEFTNIHECLGMRSALAEMGIEAAITEKEGTGILSVAHSGIRGQLAQSGIQPNYEVLAKKVTSQFKARTEQAYGFTLHRKVAKEQSKQKKVTFESSGSPSSQYEDQLDLRELMNGFIKRLTIEDMDKSEEHLESAQAALIIKNRPIQALLSEFNDLKDSQKLSNTQILSKWRKEDEQATSPKSPRQLLISKLLDKVDNACEQERRKSMPSSGR